MRTLERTDATLLILFLSLLAFPLLYAFRSFDDNTLTSWRWVFAHTSPALMFLLLIPACGLGLVLSRVGLPERFEPVLLFVSACIAVVPLWSEPELIIDASRYFLQAAHLEREGAVAFFRDWGGELPAWTDLPLIPFLYGLLFRTFGEHRIVIQFFTTVLFACAVVQTCLIGRRLWDRETGFLASLLLLAMPYLLTQVPLMLVDVPALCLITISLHAFLIALDCGGTARIAAAAIAMACAVLTKYSVAPMLFALPIAAFVLRLEGQRDAVRRAFAITSAAAALVAAVLVPQYEVVSGQLALLRSFQLPALDRWRESVASTFLFQIHPFVTISAGVGMVRAVRARDLRFMIPGGFVLMLIFLPGERIRYILPLFPLLALMAARGLRGLFDDAASRRFAAYSAVAASLVLVFAAYRPFLESTTMANLRDAGRYLDTLPGDSVRVQVLPQSASMGNTEMAIPLLDLYTRKRIIYDRQPLTRPDEQVLRRAPLRFTWEQRMPAYYEDKASGPAPRAVISDTAEKQQGPGDALKVFAADTGTFRYRTAVTVVR